MLLDPCQEIETDTPPLWVFQYEESAETVSLTWSQRLGAEHALGLGVAAAAKVCPVQPSDVDAGPTVPDDGDAAFPAVATPTTSAAATTSENS